MVLQFPFFDQSVFRSQTDFLDRLIPFLRNLPQGYEFAAEIRNKEWLDSQFAGVLRDFRVALVLQDQAWMPDIRELSQKFDPVSRALDIYSLARRSQRNREHHKELGQNRHRQDRAMMAFWFRGIGVIFPANMKAFQGEFPKGVRYWTPSESEVLMAEKELVPFLQNNRRNAVQACGGRCMSAISDDKRNEILSLNTGVKCFQSSRRNPKQERVATLPHRSVPR
jgi:Protein of unknown function DUF72